MAEEKKKRVRKEKTLEEKVNGYASYLLENGYQNDIVGYVIRAAEIALRKDGKIETGLNITRWLKGYLEKVVKEQTKGMDMWMLDEYCHDNITNYEILERYYEVLKIEAPYLFESFIFYMERNRHPKKRFYLPRKETLHIVCEDLQALEDGKKRKFYGLSMPSRVGKSTMCIFFLAWIACKRPNSHSAMGGHSGILARGFYKELCNLIVTEEYMFYELFLYMHPEYERKKFPTALSAEEYTITLGDPDRFATITCRGIDGTWTGAVDVSQDGYLYIDDLVRDREHSLSPARMENTYQEYLNKMVDRKNDGAKELMVGTLWNVLDPLMRIEEKYGETDGYVFRKIPALNENDESNFAYKINGFSTEYYREMREKLDNAEWMAKFMQRPYVREGLVFPPDELQFFNGILPEGDYRIVSACDVAWGGGDSTSMPIGAEYDNGDVYIFAWVFNNGAKEITIPLVTGQIMSNQIQQIRFEANNGGELYCQYVDEALQKNGYKCSCTHKKAPGNKEKASKIIAYSGDIKRKFYFLTPRAISYEKRQEDLENGIKRYERDKEYQKAMDELMSFVAIGKNPHDDAADSLAQLEMFIEGGSGQMAKVEFISRPF